MAFDDWNEKKKLIVTIAIGGFFVLIVWTVYAFKYSSLAKKKQILSDLEKKKSGLMRQQEDHQVRDLDKQLRETIAKFEKKKSFIPPEKDVSDLLNNDIVALMANASLTRRAYNITPGKIYNAGKGAGRGVVAPIKKQAFTLEATGTYSDALKFLNKIEEHFKRVIDVDKISLSVDAKNSTQDRTLLKMKFNFFIFFEPGGKTVVRRSTRKRPGKK